MIKVDRDAQQTNGYQRNDNLMLSSHVRADSIPGLEIEADDVRCTHGSTSGRVDEELIFYARCRGFTRQEAIKAIVTGFFQQIFDRITIESVRRGAGPGDWPPRPRLRVVHPPRGLCRERRPEPWAICKSGNRVQCIPIRAD